MIRFLAWIIQSTVAKRQAAVTASFSNKQLPRLLLQVAFAFQNTLTVDVANLDSPGQTEGYRERRSVAWLKP